MIKQEEEDKREWFEDRGKVIEAKVEARGREEDVTKRRRKIVKRRGTREEGKRRGRGDGFEDRGKVVEARR